jgi:methylglutamate dehydrogenase subunit D
VVEPKPGSPLRATELIGWSLTQLAFWPESIRAIGDALGRVHGIPVPARVGDVSGEGQIHVLRLAPGRIWIVTESSASVSPLAGVLADHVSLTTLTHGQRRYRLCGRRLRRLLTESIAIDLDGPALAPGRAAQTQLHRVPVLLHRLDREVLNLHVPRSYALWAEEWIACAVA